MSHCVAVIEFMHESNTFSVLSTGINEFQGGHYFIGEEIEHKFRQTNSEIGGFLQSVEKYGWKPVFTVATSAEAGGIVTENARKEISNEIITRLEKCSPFDGIYISFHGAMVTETSDDGETQFLKILREKIGYEIPIAVTVDLHANIFDEMEKYIDILVSYRTYPHVDMAQRAEDACSLLQRAMDGEIKPTLKISRPPMLLGCNDGRENKQGPMHQLLDLAAKESNQKGMLCISINAGFTDADVAAAGPSVIVCYDTLKTNEELPNLVSNKICSEIWKYRKIYDLPVSLADSLYRLNSNLSSSAPTVIADYSDNPGAGAYSDCTSIIQALLDLKIKNSAVGALWDPEAVKELFKSKVGMLVSINIGGKTDASVGGGPILVNGEVTALNEGNFTYEGPMYKGMQGKLGRCACLKVDGLEILIVSERIQMLDQNIFRTVGIEPKEKRVLVVKSQQHFKAAFEPIAHNIIVTDAGGLSTPNFMNREYKNIRHPIYPLDNNVSFNL